jgi:hypothetical protein
MSDLTTLDPTRALSEDEVNAAWQIILDTEASSNRDAKARMGFMVACCQLLASRDNVSGVDLVGKRNVAASPPPPPTPSIAARLVITEDFIKQVDEALPQQPWPQGVHIDVASTLGCPRKHVSAAIRSLIETGLRYDQRNGVVYDAGGREIARDAGRASPATAGDDAIEQ